MNWRKLAEEILDGRELAREEGRAILDCPQDEILALVDAAYLIRRKYFGNRVKLNFLSNIQSGICAEDCHYCSQSKISNAPIAKYSLLPKEEYLKAAERAIGAKAKRVCFVASMRGPSDEEIGQVVEAVRGIRRDFPKLEICCCLGLLTPSQAEALKESGVFAVNHNLNTSQKFYPEVCSTHTFEDRVETLSHVKEAGLSPCSGCLFGMGETDEDILDAGFQLKAIGVDSIPINFLIPIEGTMFQGDNHLSSLKCLKILCLFRFLCPQAEIRIAGGREVHLRSLQPLGLYAANSIFIGDYLTTKGQASEKDMEMILDLGFEIEGQTESFPQPAPKGELLDV